MQDPIIHAIYRHAKQLPDLPRGTPVVIQAFSLFTTPDLTDTARPESTRPSLSGIVYLPMQVPLSDVGMHVARLEEEAA